MWNILYKNIEITFFLQIAPQSGTFSLFTTSVYVLPASLQTNITLQHFAESAASVFLFLILSLSAPPCACLCSAARDSLRQKRRKRERGVCLQCGSFSESPE
ncbi:hypothetical protein ILYODFUR_017646 [Ilyodon furcidens]|uniref:Uncharacterized protein n=1 Tax=Ilyodon furcidens TaxID=33524 RepID=A0ABV0VHJ8_9TELE